MTVEGDDLDEGNETVVLQFSSASGATLSGGNATLDATGTITDDDGRGITVSETSLTLAEVDDTSTTDATENVKTYTVGLDTQPTGTVTVTVASGATGVATVSPATLTFTAQSYAAQTVTVTAVADALDNANDKRSTTITHTVSAPGTDYAAVTAASVTVEVTDDETAPSGAVTLVANPRHPGGVRLRHHRHRHRHRAGQRRPRHHHPRLRSRWATAVTPPTEGTGLRHGGGFHADGCGRLADRHRDLHPDADAGHVGRGARARRSPSLVPPPSPA